MIAFRETRRNYSPRNRIQVPNVVRKRGADSSPISTIIWRNSVRQRVGKRCIDHVSGFRLAAATRRFNWHLSSEIPETSEISAYADVPIVGRS
jgi:hypothetical protein